MVAPVEPVVSSPIVRFARRAMAHPSEESMIDEPIHNAIEDGVLTITLNRPDRLNALTDPMLDKLGRSFKQAARDDGVRSVVVTGAGRAFCAGQDLAAVRDRDDDAAMSFKQHLEGTYNRIIQAITELEKPVIAAVNGVAAGAGASLAFACDLRFASEDATFVTAFAKVGLVPDSGSTYFLPRLIGYPRAYMLYAQGGRFSAAEALSWGAINEACPADQTLARAQELATELAAGPTKALGLTKRAMRRGLERGLADALDYEAQLQQIAGETSDHHEGLTAFLEKRAARFEGH